MFRVFLLWILMSSVVFAQIEKKPKAYIFAEVRKASNAEVKKHFDDFYKKLKSDNNLQGYIINYGTAKEIAKRENQIRNSINSFDDDAPRLTLVRGGNKEKLKSVFWIVPNGAEPPTP